MISLNEFIYQPLQSLPGPLAARTQYFPATISPYGIKSPIIETAYLPRTSESRNMEKYTLRGNKMRTKQHFFDEISAVLQFPGYFGENWDACEECLHDLSWISAENIILDFLAPEEVLYDAPDDFTIFADIYQRIFFEYINCSNNKAASRTFKFLLSTSQVENSTLVEQWSVPGISPVYWLV